MTELFAEPAGGWSDTDIALAPTVAVIDDHPLWRDVLRTLLELRGVGRVVAEAEDVQRGIEAVVRTTPEVVVMDINLAGNGDGIEAARRIKGVVPDTAVLFLTAVDEPRSVLRAIATGARGYVCKTSDAEVMVDAVRRVADGDVVFPSDVSALLARTPLLQLLANEVREKGEAALGRDGPTDGARAKALFDDGLWVFTYGDRTVHLPVLNGLTDIVALLAVPGTPIAAIDLVLARNRAVRWRPLHLVDDVELEASREDPDEVARATEAVVDGVDAALVRVDRVHPALAAHLRRCVFTGTSCVYVPDEPVTWTVL